MNKNQTTRVLNNNKELVMVIHPNPAGCIDGLGKWFARLHAGLVYHNHTC